MPAFCTRCGTAVAARPAFCDNCGAPLAASMPATVAAAHAGSASAASLPPAARPKGRLGLLAGAVGAVLLAGAAAGYFLLRAPEPTQERLLAAAKVHWSAAELEPLRRQLCIANTDYRTEPFNVNAWDQRTQRWMNALAAAGLYQPGTQAQGGGLFAQPLVQYLPTPELAKYRDGSRLCLARQVQLADVREVGAPATDAKTSTVSATLLLQAADAAPWLANPEVRAVVLPQVPGWDYEDGRLQRQVRTTFTLRDGEWVGGGPASRPEGLAGRAVRLPAREPAPPAASMFDQLRAAFASAFSFAAANPLQGTWRASAGTVMGLALPAGLGADLRFTADAFEAGGTATRVRYEVEGNRVKVTPEGQPQSLVFVMQGSDAMVFEMLGLRYERVR